MTPTQQTRPTLGGPYTPAHDAPPRRMQLGTAIAVASLAVTLLSAAISYGVTVAQIDTKVDAVEYQKDRTTLEQRLGQMQGDLRVIRCAVRPEAC